MKLTKNKKIAELIGIILGDGSIQLDYDSSHYSCEIAFNYMDEKEYLFYVKSLIESIFNIVPSLQTKRKDNCAVLRIFQKKIVESLVDVGVVPGNKIKNQVGVPEWIKNCSKNSIISACIKGLFDTDGSIFLSRYKKKNYISLGLNFTNGSKILVKDFKKLSSSLGIFTSKIYKYEGRSKYGTPYIGYSTRTEAKDNVHKFLREIVKPFKWTLKKPIIERELLSYGITIEDIFKYKRKTYS
ncbi:MAG: LAGLIDADG family homing endonuclease [Promethearchaeota archaeon]